MTQVRYFSFSEELSHSVISQICLAYLLQFNTSEPHMNLNASSPLAKYAAKHWIIHTHSSCKNKSHSSSVLSLMMRLLTDENNVFMNWVEIYNIDGYSLIQQKQWDRIAKPLYYASLAGMTEASCGLLEMSAEVNAQGGVFGSALQAASCQDDEAIAKLLI